MTTMTKSPSDAEVREAPMLHMLPPYGMDVLDPPHCRITIISSALPDSRLKRETLRLVSLSGQRKVYRAPGV